MTHRDVILPPTADVIIDALERTRDLIEAGHCQGQAHTIIDETDAWCLMAALAKSCNTIRNGNTIIPGKTIHDACLHTLRIAINPQWAGNLADFNDASTTDAVVLLCSRAIGIVRSAA